MSRVHLVGGEKGGVGKSTVARLLTQWCIDQQQPFAAADADTSHGSLSRAYSEFSQPVDFHQFSSADQIMDRALAADRRVIVDLPAQSARPLEIWLESGDVLQFARQAGVRLTLWHVSDGGFDSVRDLERVLARFGDQLEYVALKNHGRARDFSQFDSSEAKERLLALGGRIVDLPELDPATMFAIDRSGVSFWAAVNREGDEAVLSPMARQRTRLWLGKAYNAFESLGDLL
ncbi:MAG TPA: hypothetical protein VLC09_15940 [Polyangiaceae bacterium]|nr:hypothetical protein [Polyangiaceae bacterium]